MMMAIRQHGWMSRFCWNTSNPFPVAAFWIWGAEQDDISGGSC
jgi:hypothetical protein